MRRGQFGPAVIFLRGGLNLQNNSKYVSRSVSILLCFLMLLTTPVFGATRRDITQTQNRQPLLVILIEYNDIQFSTCYAEDTTAFWSDRFFGETGITANAYFREVSGPFNLQFTQPKFTVPNGFSECNPVRGVSSLLIQDGVAKVRINRNHPNRNTIVGSNIALQRDGNLALRAILPHMDLSGITRFQNRILSEDLNIYFVVAGFGFRGPNSGFVPNLHPYMPGHASVREVIDANGRTRNYSFHDNSLRAFGVSGELFAHGIPLGLGTVVHELMHLLGLPDLYSFTEGFGIGPFSLMSHGSSGAYGRGAIRGSMPVHLDAWSKYVLGFIEPIEITYGEHWIGYVESIAGHYNVLKITNPNVCPYQFFLVENRQLYGFDRGLDRWWGMYGGILIYHVDKRVFEYRGRSYRVNCNNHHQTVSLERYYGTILMAFFTPFYVEGDVFGPTTTPNSNFHDTCPEKPQEEQMDCHPQILPSGVEIRVNSPSGHKMEVAIRRARNFRGVGKRQRNGAPAF